MAIIKTPVVGVSPYDTTATTPIVLRADANGNTVLANPPVAAVAAAAAAAAADTTATNTNSNVYVTGQEALNRLITTNSSGVFAGANVTINLEEQNFTTTNQVTSNTNYPSGNIGEIQFNSGSNSFASNAYFTYADSNIITPGIRTDGYFYSNGSPFTGGGNAAIGNFVFTGDNMTIAHVNSALNIKGNSTGNNENYITINPTNVDIYAFNTYPYSFSELYLDNGNTEAPYAQIIVDGNSTPQQTWSFAADGTTQFPGNLLQPPEGNPLDIKVTVGNAYSTVSLYENTSQLIIQDNTTGPNPAWALFEADLANVNTPQAVVILKPGDTGNEVRWYFDALGNLTLPGNTSSINYANNQSILSPLGTFNASSQDSNIGSFYTWHNQGSGNNTYISSGNTSGNVGILSNKRTFITTEWGSGNPTWTFDEYGNLTLPGNIIAINYANGNRITGNVTFKDEIVIGTGTSNLISGLYLAPSSSSANANMYLRVRGNITDEPTHIHFDTGNNQYYNQFIGDDNKYIQLANTGNIVINSNDLVGNAAQWTFGANGTTKFPANTIQAPAGSPITVRATSGNTYSRLAAGDNFAQIGLQDDTTGAYQAWAYVETDMANVNTPSAVVIIKPGDTGTEVRWNFDATGNLTLPANTFAVNYANNQPVVISGGAAGLPLANGTSNINIATANGNVTVTANATTWTFGLDSKITLPNGASLNDTSGDSVAFGQNAGLTSQDQHAVAIGRDAGSLYQGEDSIAIGYQAGYHDQQRGVAIGYQAGIGGTLYRSVSAAQGGSGPVTTYSPSAPPDPSRLYVASTTNILTSQRVFGNNIQANTVVTAVYPGEDRVDISPNYTAAMSSGDLLTFVGVIIGINDASNIVYQMRVTGTDIPDNTFVQSTGCSVVTLSQYPTAPLIDGAGLVFNIGQGAYSIAVGYQAGETFQAAGAVAIGYSAGKQNQSQQAVAVGQFAGYNNQSANAVAVGTNAGEFTQAVNTVAVGYKAGYYQQGKRAVAIGEDAGYNIQGEDAVAMGQKAGQFSQGQLSIAIGNTAGHASQQNQAVAIGYGAGYDTQGVNSIAIGALAGQSAQGNNSIVINATGSAVGSTSGANTFTVKPVRGDITANLVGGGFKAVYYNSSTGEFAFVTD